MKRRTEWKRKRRHLARALEVALQVRQVVRKARRARKARKARKATKG